MNYDSLIWPRLLLSLTVSVAVITAPKSWAQPQQVDLLEASALFSSQGASSALCTLPRGASFEIFSSRQAESVIKIFAKQLPAPCAKFKSGWLQSSTVALSALPGQAEPSEPITVPDNSVTAAYDKNKPVYGVWIPQRWLQSRDSMTTVIRKAQAAGLDTLYPVAARYSCAYFKSSVLPYCDQRGDRLAVFTKLVAALAPEMVIIPWFERNIQVKYTFLNERSDLVDPASTAADFPTLDLDLPEVRDRIASSLAEVMAYPGVVGVHVDDGFEYIGEKTDFLASRAFYTRKLTYFVRDQLQRFKQRFPNALFELSHLPQPFAKNAYLADWENWQVDRYIIQCYRSSAAKILASRECFNAVNYAKGRLSGIGVAGLANGTRLSSGELLQVLANQVRDGKSFVLFEAGELVASDALVSGMARLLK